MNRHSVNASRHGNGNLAVDGFHEIADGALYRLPTGELVRASVVPHPDALPEYWSETPGGGDSWPLRGNLLLSLFWPPQPSNVTVGLLAAIAYGDYPGPLVGPAQVTFLTAACVAGVRWAEGSYILDLDSSPELVRKVGEPTTSPGWPIQCIAPTGPDEELEFDHAVTRAKHALHRLLVVKDLMSPDQKPPQDF